MKDASQFHVFIVAVVLLSGLGSLMVAEAGENPEQGRQLVLEKKYLLVPVKNGARMRRVVLQIDGKTVREFDAELALEKPSFWCFLDITAFKGKTGILTVKGAGKTYTSKMVQSDEIPNFERWYPNRMFHTNVFLYKERHRQQFHFSSRRGWNNDPNGLVYYKGEYHLYYQHNPYGWKWGNMHWGHAVSKDLVHWKELPIAIYPHRFGDWVFSGSAAVDWGNTAGFKTGENDVIVAAYTSTGRGEAIAYSNDRGRTFTEYKGNPVVRHSGRDPKIIWYAPGKHWVMTVYDQRGRSRGIAFYNSPDLKKWEFRSRIDGYYECPEIFELPVDGDKKNTRWVVYGADGHYTIGKFDGKTFTKESGKHRGNFGNCFYASQTFNDIPPEDGRRIQIAWGRINTPDMPFNQCMLFPCELTLHTTDEGIRMFAKPVKEIETIHTKKHALKNKTLKEGENLLSGIKGELFDIRAEFEVGDAKEFGFIVRGDQVVYNVKEQQLACRGNKARLKPENGKIRMQILVDRTSIEAFGNDGRVYIPMGVIHPANNKSIELFTRGGNTKLNDLAVYELKSAWE